MHTVTVPLKLIPESGLLHSAIFFCSKVALQVFKHIIIIVLEDSNTYIDTRHSISCQVAAASVILTIEIAFKKVADGLDLILAIQGTSAWRKVVTHVAFVELSVSFEESSESVHFIVLKPPEVFDHPRHIELASSMFYTILEPAWVLVLIIADAVLFETLTILLAALPHASVEGIGGLFYPGTVTLIIVEAAFECHRVILIVFCSDAMSFVLNPDTVVARTGAYTIIVVQPSWAMAETFVKPPIVGTSWNCQFALAFSFVILPVHE